jgi:1,4-dihydroxy-2-naphthoate octaprenyltransferase
MTIGKKLYAWFSLSRPPFHLVGVLPFILGGVLAWQHVGFFRWDIFAWGSLGVTLIMLATYYAGGILGLFRGHTLGKTGSQSFRGRIPNPPAGTVATSCTDVGIAGRNGVGRWNRVDPPIRL